MPVISVVLIEGYPAEVRQRLCEKLTDATMAVIAAPVEGVTVYINEVAPAGYMRGRAAKTPGIAPRPAAEVCLDFLSAVGTRDFTTAQGMIAPGFEMVFPGNARFSAFSELADWAGTRYRRIEKRIERVEEAALAGRVSVYVSGTLSGEWLDGTAFDSIRFIDRFELRGETILNHQVWNDLDGVMAARVA